MKNKKAYQNAAALVMTFVIGIYFVISNITAYASDIIVTGDAAGSLRVTSADTMLFDLAGLYPGDTSASSATIRNTDLVNDGFEVFMYASNTAGAAYDLGRVTRLTVTDGNTTIYDDMLIDFDEVINSVTPISLGRLAQGTSKNLNFDIEIDGKKADNNYQEQQSHFVVTFVASSYGAPVVTPDPGGGGGRGGGGGGGTPASLLVSSETPTLTPESSEVLDITNDNVPRGIIEPDKQDVPPGYDEIDEQDVPVGYFELVADENLDDDEVPRGTIKEMPKTGEISLVLYIVSGVIIICCGLFIIMGKGKKKVSSTLSEEDRR